MLNKLKCFLICIFSVFLTFLNTADSIKLNASSDISIKNIDDFTSIKKQVEKGYIDEFLVSYISLNSSLNPQYDERYDDIYKDLYYADYTNNPRLEWYTNDILYEYDSKETFTQNIDGVDYELTDSFINIGNNSGYKNPDLESINQNDINYFGYYTYDDGMVKKTGLSSVNGISLISNDIYLNTYFDNSLKENNNLDIALKNESKYKIQWIELFNKLSKSANGFVFQYPLIKVNDNEYVNILFNGGKAYITTHNCRFSISSDKSTIYLSLPYMEYIEKISVSVPFFTGGFDTTKTEEVTSDYDGVNNIVQAYASGKDIIDEMNEVMTSFKPYLWNNESNNKGSKYIYYQPLHISEFINSENLIIFKSPIYLEFTCSSLTLNNVLEREIKEINVDIDDSGLYEYAYCNYVNGYKSTIYDKKYNYYYVKHTNDFSSLCGTIRLKNMQCRASSNYNYIQTSLFFAFQKSTESFKINKNYSAYIIWGDYNLGMKKNKNKYAITGFNYCTHSFKDDGTINFSTKGSVVDESFSYRQFVYFDFYWDEGLTKKIHKIDSLYVVLPLATGDSVILQQKDIQNLIDNPDPFFEAEDYVFYNLYKSDVISGYYNEFLMPTPDSALYDYAYSQLMQYQFLKTNCRFMYSHYLHTYGEDEAKRIDKEKMEKDSSSTYAQLTVMINANEIVKCTTAVDGSHIEYDDKGNVIGIFNQYGEKEEDKIVNDDGYIVDKDTGLPVKNNYYFQDIQPLYDEQTAFENFIDRFIHFFTSIADFFNNFNYKALFIALGSILGIIVIIFVISKIVKSSYFLSLKANIKKLSSNKNRPKNKTKKVKVKHIKTKKKNRKRNR